MNESRELDAVQRASQEQFARQSHRYAKGHILEDVADVAGAIAGLEIPPGAEVLDVACGAGHTGLYFAGLGHRVTCSDLTEAMLERVREAASRKGLGVKTVRHAAEVFPFENGQFDWVTCRVAAHHFSNCNAFVSEVRRVLRPGGHFLLIDGSAPDGNPIAEEWLHQVEKLRDPSHNRFLTPDRWRSLCNGAGLEVVRCGVTPFKQPDLEWYFETAATSAANRKAVLELVRTAPVEARAAYGLAEEAGKIIWWWPRLALVARVKG